MKAPESESPLKNIMSTVNISSWALLDLQKTPPNNFPERWVNENKYGAMEWFAKNAGKRQHPMEIEPDYPAALVIADNYYSAAAHKNSLQNKIAIYAQGRDYHKIIRTKLKFILRELQKNTPEIKGRIFVDTGALSEKYLAVCSGLGWYGKNTLLITPDYGSYVVIGILLLSKPADKWTDKNPLNPFKNRCNGCRICLDCCPTGALYEPYRLDAGKCLSRLTIEDNAKATTELPEKTVFGCDICQTCCPFNKIPRETTEPDYLPRIAAEPDKIPLDSEKNFLEYFTGSPVRRTGWQKFKDNMQKCHQNTKNNH
jgi:epoxyqueuosine reductase